MLIDYSRNFFNVLCNDYEKIKENEIIYKWSKNHLKINIVGSVYYILDINIKKVVTFMKCLLYSINEITSFDSSKENKYGIYV